MILLNIENLIYLIINLFMKLNNNFKYIKASLKLCNLVFKMFIKYLIMILEVKFNTFSFIQWTYYLKIK